MSKIVCRKAKLEDVPAIVDIAVESVSRDPLPVKIDREAMAETARTCLNPAHFMWVAEQDGKVVASVAACVQPSFWYQKLQCSVLLYYTQVPGAGVAAAARVRSLGQVSLGDQGRSAGARAGR